jgi:cell shape-determining protein MreC
LAENEGLKNKIAELEKERGRGAGLERENQELKGQLNASVRKMEEFKMKISILEENVSIM